MSVAFKILQNILYQLYLKLNFRSWNVPEACFQCFHILSEFIDWVFMRISLTLGEPFRLDFMRTESIAHPIVLAELAHSSAVTRGDYPGIMTRWSKVLTQSLPYATVLWSFNRRETWEWKVHIQLYLILNFI